MSYKFVLTANPGVQINQPFQTGLTAQAIDIWNASPFDLDYYGFGALGQVVVPAGTGNRFWAKDYNAGVMNILPVNNNAVSGTGVINITVYNIADRVPAGTFPTGIPVQVVQAKVTSVPFLQNDGNPAGTQIIESTVSGAPGSTWSFNNDGTGFLAVLISNVVTKLVQTATADPLLKLGAAGHNTQVLGTFESVQAATMDAALTVTGDATFNGAGTGVSVANNLSVTGTSALTGDVTLSGNETLNVNNKFFKGKDQAGTIYQIAGYDSVTAKQLDISDSTAGILANILSNTKVNGTFESTGIATLDALLNLIGQAPTTISGSVAGTAKFYVPIWGTGLKICICQLNGWNSASVGTFTFPTSGGGIAWGMGLSVQTLGTMTWGLFIGSTAQSLRHITGLGANNAAGTDNPETALHGDNLVGIDLSGGAATSMQVGTTGGVAITGAIFIIGN